MVPLDVAQDLDLYLTEEEVAQKALHAVSSVVGRQGDVWVVLTDRSLFFHTRETGRDAVVALLPRIQLAEIVYLDHVHGITLTFVSRRAPRNTTKITFLKSQGEEIDNFCEDLADIITFQKQTPEGLKVLAPRRDALRPLAGKQPQPTGTPPMMPNSRVAAESPAAQTPPSGTVPSTAEGSPPASMSSAPSELPDSAGTTPPAAVSLPVTTDIPATGPTAPVAEPSVPPSARFRPDGPLAIPTPEVPPPASSPAMPEVSTGNAAVPNSPLSPRISAPTRPTPPTARASRTSTATPGATPSSVPYGGPIWTPPVPSQRPPGAASEPATEPAPEAEVRLATPDASPRLSIVVLATAFSLLVAFLWYSLFRSLSRQRP